MRAVCGEGPWMGMLLGVCGTEDDQLHSKQYMGLVWKRRMALEGRRGEGSENAMSVRSRLAPTAGGALILQR